MKLELVLLCVAVVATVSNAAEIVSARLEVSAYHAADSNHVYAIDLWWMTTEQATIGKKPVTTWCVLCGFSQVKKFINELLPL